MKILRKLFSPLWIMRKPKPVGPEAAGGPLVLFVHGFTATSLDTWGDWFDRISKESDFANYRIDSFSYQTAVISLPFGIRIPTISEIASGLSTEINHRYKEHSAIFIVAHSMGGLIARQFVLGEMKSGRPVGRYRLIMYGTPNDGVALANLAGELGIHGQLGSMKGSADFLATLNADWDRLEVGAALPVRYVVGGGDQVVTPSSAGFSEKTSTFDLAIDLNHSSIVDVSKELPFQILTNFVKQSSMKDGDPLFTVYNIGDEPYYLVRSRTDAAVGRAISARHVWLYGASGVGKTSLLRRNALSGGWKLVTTTLSTIGTQDSLSLQSGFLARIADALGRDVFQSSEEFIQCCKGISQLAPVCFLIEEIPFPDSQTYDETSLWFSRIAERLDAENSTCGRVRLAFSSINPPATDGSTTSNQIRDRISFIEAPMWGIDDLSALLELIVTRLNLQISKEDRSQIVASSNGHPRFVKQVVRDIALDIGQAISVADRIGRIRGGEA